MIKFNTQKSRYSFFIGLVLLSLIQGLYFLDKWNISQGLKNLVLHHNLIDTDAFFIGGISGAFVNAGLALMVMLILFAITKTKITSGEYPALLLTYAYAFYGKNFLNIIPLALGVYIYAFIKKNKLSSVSPFACYAGAFSPIVSTLAFHTPALNDLGLGFSIVFAILVGLISGYAITAVSKWMPNILKGRSILLGAACVGVVAIVVTNGLRAFGFQWLPYEKPPFIDQVYSTAIYVNFFIVLLYFTILGFLSDTASLKDFADIQLGKKSSAALIEDYGFGLTVLSTGLFGMVLLLYMVILPTTEAHGELWAGLFTAAAFVSKGLNFRNALPFYIGMIGFNFTSYGFAGSMAGNGFIQSGLARIGSRATMMGTYVGSNIAPMNAKLGPKRGMIMGILYAIIVPLVSSLHHQTVLYNSGFAIAITVILYNVADQD